MFGQTHGTWSLFHWHKESRSCLRSYPPEKMTVSEPFGEQAIAANSDTIDGVVGWFGDVEVNRVNPRDLQCPTFEGHIGG
jgi:hypothetical protein